MRSKYTFVIITEESKLTRERRGYYNALIEEEQNVKHIVVKDGEKISQNQINEDDILLWGDQGLIPRNLFHFSNMKIAFHIDTFSDTSFKLELAKHFDLNIVFHFEFESYFKNILNNQQVLFLPHAIEKKHIADNSILKKNREYELAFVGDIKRSQYSVRKEMVEYANQFFKMNDISSFISYEKMIELYKQSKIVLNIPRNDYLKDGNLRAFEAMASGAVLCNYTPTELYQIGFKENIDFIGFSSKEELIHKVKNLLQRPEHLEEIAKNGYLKTLNHNTYNARVRHLINYINHQYHTLNKKSNNNINYIFILQALKHRKLTDFLKHFFSLIFNFEFIHLLKINRIVLQRLFKNKPLL